MLSIQEVNAISIARVIATLMVVTLHLGPHYYNGPYSNFIYMLLTLSVPVFFSISGFLSGIKRKPDNKKYVRQRLIRLLPSYYIVLIIIFVGLLIENKHFRTLDLISNIINLQGIVELRYSIPYSQNYWFISIILLCYILTPLIKRSISNLVKFYIFCIVIVFLQIILISLGFKSLPVYITYLFVYTICYAIGYYWKGRNIRKSIILIFTFVAFISGLIRIIFHNLHDGTVLYNLIIAPYSSIIQSVWFLFFIIYLFNSFRGKNILFDNKIINFLDKISYEVYLTHGLYIYGPIGMTKFTNSDILNVFLIVIFVIVTAYFINVLSNKVVKSIFKLNSTQRELGVNPPLS